METGLCLVPKRPCSWENAAAARHNPIKDAGARTLGDLAEFLESFLGVKDFGESNAEVVFDDHDFATSN